jgi:hypothetical protein
MTRDPGLPHEAQFKIEGEARRIALHLDQVPSEHQIELSKAISLKRIADALHGGHSVYGLNDLVEAIREGRSS